MFKPKNKNIKQRKYNYSILNLFEKNYEFDTREFQEEEKMKLNLVKDINTLKENLMKVSTIEFEYFLEINENEVYDIDIMKLIYDIASKLDNYQYDIIEKMNFDDIKYLIDCYYHHIKLNQTLNGKQRKIEIFETIPLLKQKFEQNFINILNNLNNEIQRIPNINEINLSKITNVKSEEFINNENKRLQNQFDPLNNKIIIKNNSTICEFFEPFLIKRMKIFDKRIELPINKFIDNSFLIENDNEKIPILCKCEKNNIIIKAKDFIHEIPFAQIWFMILINTNDNIKSVLQIIKKDHSSFLIDFRVEDNLNQFLGNCNTNFNLDRNKIIFNSEFNINSKIEIVRNSWLANKISTFEFISVLNLLNGRTYQNPYKKPIFPILDESDFNSMFTTNLRNSNGTEILYSNSDDENSKLAIEKYYNKRKQLEKEDETVCKWIIQNFPNVLNQTIIKRSKSMVNIPQVEVKFNSKVLYVIPIKIEKTYFIIFENGICAFIKIYPNATDDLCPECRQIGDKFEIIGINDYKFYPYGNSIVAYNGSTLVTFRYLERPQVITESEIFITNLKFSYPLYIFNDTKIYSSPNLQQIELCNLNSNILCIASNERIRIFAYVSTDSILRIKSLNDGKLITKVSLDNELPIDILITNAWGFILVRTINKLYIISTNGIILKVVNDFPNILSWKTFASNEGFDFLLMETDKNEILYCDVLYPEKLKLIAKFHSKCLDYFPEEDSFVLVSAERKFAFISKEVVENLDT